MKIRNTESKPASTGRRACHLLTLGLIAALCTGSALAAPADDPVARLKAGMPRPVAALIDRLVECNHWSGEEPYDQGRRKEIDAAIASLRCQSLDRDLQKMLRRYPDDPKIAENLRRARDEAF